MQAKPIYLTTNLLREVHVFRPAPLYVAHGRVLRDESFGVGLVLWSNNTREQRAIKERARSRGKQDAVTA